MPPFPQTGFLTPLDPPAENPLSEDGAWLQFNTQPPLQKLVTGGNGYLTDSEHGETNYSYWTRRQFSSSGLLELWACITGGQLGAAVESWRVVLATSVGDSWNGYLVLFGGGIFSGYTIRRYSGGDFTNIGGASAGFPDKLGIRIDGNDIQAWGEYGGVWSLEASVSDTTHRGMFYLALGIEDPTGGGLSISCVGGGIPNRTQIYRLVQGRRRVEAV
jgi:hypothetical protein